MGDVRDDEDHGFDSTRVLVAKTNILAVIDLDRATKRFWIFFDSFYHLAPQQKGLIPANIETMTRITLQAKSMCFISGSLAVQTPNNYLALRSVLWQFALEITQITFSVCNEYFQESGINPPILDSADIKYIGRSTEDRI